LNHSLEFYVKFYQNSQNIIVFFFKKKNSYKKF